jgi:hypothetical protein
MSINQLIECTTSVFEDKPSPMLKIIPRFGKHFCYHLQGEYEDWEFLILTQARRYRWRIGFGSAD